MRINRINIENPWCSREWVVSMVTFPFWSNCAGPKSALVAFSLRRIDFFVGCSCKELWRKVWFRPIPTHSLRSFRGRIILLVKWWNDWRRIYKRISWKTVFLSFRYKRKVLLVCQLGIRRLRHVTTAL